jgi:predicted AAA+ superfamily ATPase
LDEIQNVDDWPIVIRRFHDSKNVEIFLTGSSAKLLSKEIATSLRGRSLATEIWPLSFKEYLKVKQKTIDRTIFDKKTKDNLIKTFHSYLTEGGFPEVNKYNADVRQQILQEYIDIVLFRDIVERHKIKNPSLIKYMILSMLNNVSNPFTINKFYNELKSRGFKTSKDILYEYADYIEDAYLGFLVPIHDKSIRKTQMNPKKIYAIDPGLVRATTLDYDGDLGKLFENVIYLDLRRLGCKINYYLTSKRYEVDFIIKSSKGNKKFFQVVWNTEDKETYSREKKALDSAIGELKIKGDIITLESYLRDGINLF